MTAHESAKTLQLADKLLDLDRPAVMGILNATPDSFSEDQELSTDQLYQRGLQMAEEGATILDVGGESAVTNRSPVSGEEEIERVLPLIERLASTTDVIISVDTYKSEVAGAAIESGATMVNDVSGLRDPEMARICAGAQAALVIMHTSVEPKKKLAHPKYEDVLDDVTDFLKGKIELAVDNGMSENALVVDPGPDFAKTPGQTVQMLRDLPRLQSLGRPVLLAASRKDFVGALTRRMPRDRLAGSLAAIAYGAAAGARIFRVHDVRETVDFLSVWLALNGESEVSEDMRISDEIRWQQTGVT